MLYVENDRDLIAAVSRALGESRSLVKNRGFQLIEIVVVNGDESILNGGRTARDRHPQPLTGSHATVRTAREKGGFKTGLR